MKTFTFKYDPHPTKTAFNAISRSVKAGKGSIRKDEIACRSMDDMMKIMSKIRFQLFTTIVEKAPDSVTELAKMLDKDLGNVLKDVRILESLGLVELKRRKAKRGTKIRPVALYDRIVFECEPKQGKKASGF
ncbi:MAG: hypothetical protein AB1540_18020 [Bdellovibrionota bacterium]